MVAKPKLVCLYATESSFQRSQSLPLFSFNAMEPVKKTISVGRDPWARFEAWRYHPSINKHANIRRMFPGLGWGIGVFIVACALEKVFEKPDEGHH